MCYGSVTQKMFYLSRIHFSYPHENDIFIKNISFLYLNHHISQMIRRLDYNLILIDIEDYCPSMRLTLNF